MLLVESHEVACWRSMMQSHHPQGEPRVPGKSLKYWLTSEQHGCLGGFSFHAAGWHELARDQWIYWTQCARVTHLGQVLNSTRFLILPTVRIHGLASVALRGGTTVVERLA